MRRAFAIVSDIDGVIVRGKQLIPKSDYVLQDCFRRNIPLYLLTNGGGCLEKQKAAAISTQCGVNIPAENVILNFTPLRAVMAAHQGLALICGAGKIEEIATDSGLKSFVSINNLTQDYIDSQAIFILYDPVKWEVNFDAIIQILSKNPTCPIYVVNNDITYADQFQLPRLAFGAFTNALLKVIQNVLHIKPNIIYYGKPTLNTYNYVGSLINTGINRKIYMIGDNPKSDIRGANQANWTSILVRSGIFKGDNDIEDPAHYVVDNMYDAYQLILKQNM